MLTIAKNIHFTKLVKAGNTLKEFNFRKLQAFAQPVYHIDVTDDRANRIIFKMQKEETGWLTQPTVIPVWIKQIETSLKEILELQEQGELPHTFTY